MLKSTLVNLEKRKMKIEAKKKRNAVEKIGVKEFKVIFIASQVDPQIKHIAIYPKTILIFSFFII